LIKRYEKNSSDIEYSSEIERVGVYVRVKFRKFEREEDRQVNDNCYRSLELDEGSALHMENLESTSIDRKCQC
jgi:hypothetical protein